MYNVIYTDSGFPNGLIIEFRTNNYTKKDLMMIKDHYSLLGFNGKFAIERELYASKK